MPTKKKITRKKAAPKKAARKTTTRKTSARSKKTAYPRKVATKATPIPRGREQKLAEQALKLVDQAAAALRTGVRESAQTTAKSRIAAKKRAHDLLGQASSNLSKALNSGTSALQSLIGKL